MIMSDEWTCRYGDRIYDFFSRSTIIRHMGKEHDMNVAFESDYQLKARGNKDLPLFFTKKERMLTS